jgi:aryl-alcohol dehydrogenase-like predicted oxidoreductase
MAQEKTDPLLGVLLEHGVNHIDTAIDYGDAELRLAPWLRDHRDDFFLATKTHERTGPAARASLERSLERLGVDQVDLIQCHNLVEPDEWEVAHAPGGAVEALAQARDEGLVRFIGVTGHGLRIAGMHLRSLERFDFDSVLLPYNFALLSNDDYQRDVDALLAVCAERRVAVQTIKSAALRRWEEGEGPRYSWYKPLEDVDALRRAVRFVLGNSQLFLITSSDAHILPSVLDAAETAPSDGMPTDAELEADALALGVRPLFDGAELERI